MITILIADLFCIGMACQKRNFCNGGNIVKGLVRGMGYFNGHPKRIAIPDKFFP